MFDAVKRLALAGLGALALAGCAVIPGGNEAPVRNEPAVMLPPPPPPPPDADALPVDVERHRIALLVPLSGENAEVGQSIANASTMALLDTGAQNLRITTYDTGAGAGDAARRAVADGNRLILGPLVRDDVAPVLAAARPAATPLLTFSNDTSVAQRDVFVMGHIPDQSVARVVTFAVDQGARTFAALAPRGDYGDRALRALEQAVTASGARVVRSERYDRNNTSILSAADRLRAAGGYDTVLIADGARLAAMAAPRLKDAGQALPSIIGTELWSREDELTRTPALRGAWFAAVPDARYRQFAASYVSRFGSEPYRIATLGYDSVLLTLRLARDWQPGRPLVPAMLTDEGGFLGLDGPIRFSADGVGHRALEVRQIGNGAFTVVDPAPTGS
ncbi:penicillin-binding protein activator [Aurantiacibacter luteus]|uniref:ABC transporter substrate-binding protein n=1 Tax=Aurantiacibacter luteus TaxID=1581420 RepID=A0A0G9MY46_9SPHN|nr:penicillin-binding protein activator [Aurantiacibacter luteus]KLE35524.1 ABC transporter substrate-binding protein [Aurantiacibacter luteus]